MNEHYMADEHRRAEQHGPEQLQKPKFGRQFGHDTVV